jgi:bifunctional ADP-heptose synthase (sugar kinase/adenylyltransferase)
MSLKAIIEKEKAAGKRVVFGNGCFDYRPCGARPVPEGGERNWGMFSVVAVND